MLYTLGHACPNPNDSIRSVTKSARIPFYCWPSFENVATTTTSLYVDGRVVFFFFAKFPNQKYGKCGVYGKKRHWLSIFYNNSAIDYMLLKFHHQNICIEELCKCPWKWYANMRSMSSILWSCRRTPATCRRNTCDCSGRSGSAVTCAQTLIWGPQCPKLSNRAYGGSLPQSTVRSTQLIKGAG